MSCIHVATSELARSAGRKTERVLERAGKNDSARFSKPGAELPRPPSAGWPTFSSDRVWSVRAAGTLGSSRDSGTYTLPELRAASSGPSSNVPVAVRPRKTI